MDAPTVSRSPTPPDGGLLARARAASGGLEELEPLGLKRYRLDDLLIAFAAYVVSSSDASAASALLASGGTKVPAQTIRAWVGRYPKRLARVAAVFGPELEAAAVERFQSTADVATGVALAALELERERIARGEVKDAGASARNAMVTAGIATEKKLLLQSRPTAIVETRTGEETLRALEAMGRASTAFVIDATAEDVEDAEEVVVWAQAAPSSAVSAD